MHSDRQIFFFQMCLEFLLWEVLCLLIPYHLILHLPEIHLPAVIHRLLLQVLISQ